MFSKGDWTGPYPHLEGSKIILDIQDARSRPCACAGIFLWDNATCAYVLVETKKYIELPGGRVIKGEDTFTAAKRELKEEAGISNLKEFDTRFAFAVSIPVTKSRTMMIYVLVIPFDGWKIQLSPQHSQGEVTRCSWCCMIEDPPTFSEPLNKPFRRGDDHVFWLIQCVLNQARWKYINMAFHLPTI